MKSSRPFTRPAGAIAAALLAALALLLGLILAVIGARDPRRANHRTWFVVLGAIAVAIMVVPATRYGLWYLLA